MQAATTTKRLFSIDALRGFDMWLISGGGAFIVCLKGATGMPWVDRMADQLEHTPWNGFTFYDFIFPLFLFTAGVSLAFSVKAGVQKGLPAKSIYKKAFRRMIILILLSIVDKNDPLDVFNLPQIRIAGVLARIGLATFITTFLYLTFSTKQRICIALSILILYFLVLRFIPAPGFESGDLSFEGNIVGWFDRMFLPGRLIQKTFDENGLLTQFPALCLTIAGSVAGDILQNEKPTGSKIFQLLLYGLIAVFTGLFGDLILPINKHLWSSSFIMLTAGMSFLFLLIFYWLIDVKGYKKWAFFFKVIGVNSLVIYFAYHFIDFKFTSKMLFEGFYKYAPERFIPAFKALGALVLVWGFLYILYRKKIFVKI